MAFVGVRLQKELKGIDTLGLEEKALKKTLPPLGLLIKAT